MFRARCNVHETQSFADYIMFLKLARNTRTKDESLVKLLYRSFFRYVKEPSLFKNLTELFEVDALHQNLYERNLQLISFDRDDNARGEYRFATHKTNNIK